MTALDPFDYAFHDDPYTVYEALRTACPVSHNEERDLWALARFDDVQDALRATATFSSAHGTSVEAGHQMRQFHPPAGNFIDHDPPRHDELRATVREYFSPRVVAGHEMRIREVVRSAIATLAAKGRGDLVPDFAQLVPLTIISELLGIPEEDRLPMVTWADEMHARLPGDDRIPPHGMEAGFKLYEKFAAIVGARRREPAADIITHLTRASIAGDELHDEEIIGIAFLIFLAGHDTTTQLIAHALVFLNENPETLSLLCAEPDRIPQAVEEFLRLESPVSMLARTTTADVELHERIIPAGSRVLMLYGSANRDHERFEHADVFDIEREAKRHLAFGDGVHHCLGAALARLEARVALEEFLIAFPHFQLLGPPEVHHFTSLRGIVSLPVAVDAEPVPGAQ